jgi:DNA-directed RNA polymerase specialized sigma24 family protein
VTTMTETPTRRKRAKRAGPPEAFDIAAATSRMIRAVGKRCAEEDPEQLVHLKEIQTALDEAWRTAIDGLREHQFSDRMIASALGVSQPAVTMRWRRGADRTEQR